MARIRTIKPDAFKSDTLSQIPRGVRWTFAGLWTYFDDEGRGRDNLRLIKAELYPQDDHVSLDDIATDLKQLEQIGSVCRYSADGKDYLHAPAWKEHQSINRKSEPKHPPCPVHDCAESPQGVGSEYPPQELELEGNREKEPEPVDLFPEFWHAYPRKTDKANAKKVWGKAIKKKPASEIIAAAAAYAATKPDPKFTAHASTWLNGERWDDELARAPSDSPRVYLPETPPDDIDPDDTEAYAAAMRKAASR